jgi:hypothetical protein
MDNGSPLPPDWAGLATYDEMCRGWEAAGWFCKPAVSEEKFKESRKAFAELLS